MGLGGTLATPLGAYMVTISAVLSNMVLCQGRCVFARRALRQVSVGPLGRVHVPNEYRDTRTRVLHVGVDLSLQT